MTKFVKAPEPCVASVLDTAIFLAGSIDMGSAENWQEKLSDDLCGYDNLIVFNPRRDDWDSSWIQDPTPGTKFYEQVDWEINKIMLSDVVAFYFADGSKSPITLLELGMCLHKENVVIYCTDKFYRYGNVKIVADRYKIPVCSTYEEFKAAIEEMIIDRI